MLCGSLVTQSFINMGINKNKCQYKRQQYHLCTCLCKTNVFFYLQQLLSDSYTVWKILRSIYYSKIFKCMTIVAIIHFFHCIIFNTSWSVMIVTMLRQSTHVLWHRCKICKGWVTALNYVQAKFWSRYVVKITSASGKHYDIKLWKCHFNNKQQVYSKVMLYSWYDVYSCLVQ